MSTKNALINHVLSDKHFDLRKQIHPGAKTVIVLYCIDISLHKIKRENTKILRAVPSISRTVKESGHISRRFGRNAGI